MFDSPSQRAIVWFVVGLTGKLGEIGVGSGMFVVNVLGDTKAPSPCQSLLVVFPKIVGK